MRRVAAFLVFLSTAALAGESIDPELQGRMAALEQQRNEQANGVVVMVGKLAAAQAEIERLKKQCEPEKDKPKK